MTRPSQSLKKGKRGGGATPTIFSLLERTRTHHARRLVRALAASRESVSFCRRLGDAVGGGTDPRWLPLTLDARAPRRALRHAHVPFGWFDSTLWAGGVYVLTFESGFFTRRSLGTRARSLLKKTTSGAREASASPKSASPCAPRPNCAQPASPKIAPPLAPAHTLRPSPLSVCTLSWARGSRAIVLKKPKIEATLVASHLSSEPQRLVVICPQPSRAFALAREGGGGGGGGGG